MNAPSPEDEILWWHSGFSRAMIDYAPLALGIFDEKIRHLTASPLLAEMNGRSVEDLIGRSPVEIHGPAVQDAQDMYQGVLDTRIPIREMRFEASLPDQPADVRHWVLDCLPLSSSVQRGVIVIVREVTTEVRAEHQRTETLRSLQHALEHDELTGLATRRMLYSSLGDALKASTEVSVIFGDLNGFKGVNDRFGHAVGDRVLQQVADRLRTATEEYPAMTVRHGGDEFVIVCAPSDTEALIAACRSAFAEPFVVDGAAFELSMAIGFEHAKQNDTADSLIAAADDNMYRTKKQSSPRTVRSARRHGRAD